jgi:hypothetical protein
VLAEVEGWAAEFERLCERIGPRFARPGGPPPRRRVPARPARWGRAQERLAAHQAAYADPDHAESRIAQQAPRACPTASVPATAITRWRMSATPIRCISARRGPCHLWSPISWSARETAPVKRFGSSVALVEVTAVETPEAGGSVIADAVKVVDLRSEALTAITPDAEWVEVEESIGVELHVNEAIEESVRSGDRFRFEVRVVANES